MTCPLPRPHPVTFIMTSPLPPWPARSKARPHLKRAVGSMDLDVTIVNAAVPGIRAPRAACAQVEWTGWCHRVVTVRTWTAP